jgi:hypothetical protein
MKPFSVNKVTFIVGWGLNLNVRTVHSSNYIWKFWSKAYIKSCNTVINSLLEHHSILSTILTQPTYFPTEHRELKFVCFYATKSLLSHSIFKYVKHNHWTCDVTTKTIDAMKISTETNQAHFSLLILVAAIICWCHVRIQIINHKLWKSLFVVQMHNMITLGPRPLDIIHRIQFLWFYWAIKSQFGI